MNIAVMASELHSTMRTLLAALDRTGLYNTLTLTVEQGRLTATVAGMPLALRTGLPGMVITEGGIALRKAEVLLPAIADYVRTLNLQENCEVSLEQEGNPGLLVWQRATRARFNLPVTDPPAFEPGDRHDVLLPAHDLAKALEALLPHAESKRYDSLRSIGFACADGELTLQASNGISASRWRAELTTTAAQPVRSAMDRDAASRLVSVIKAIRHPDDGSVKIALGEDFIDLNFYDEVYVRARATGRNVFDLKDLFAVLRDPGVFELDGQELQRCLRAALALANSNTPPVVLLQYADGQLLLRFSSSGMQYESVIASCRAVRGERAEIRLNGNELLKCLSSALRYHTTIRLKVQSHDSVCSLSTVDDEFSSLIMPVV